LKLSRDPDEKFLVKSKLSQSMTWVNLNWLESNGSEVGIYFNVYLNSKRSQLLEIGG